MVRVGGGPLLGFTRGAGSGVVCKGGLIVSLISFLKAMRWCYLVSRPQGLRGRQWDSIPKRSPVSVKSLVERCFSVPGSVAWRFDTSVLGSFSVRFNHSGGVFPAFPSAMLAC